MYCKCLLTTLWRHKFWKWHCYSNQAVFLHDTKFKAKVYISWERKKLLRWNKKHFSFFKLKGFQWPKTVVDLKVCFLNHAKKNICNFDKATRFSKVLKWQHVYHLLRGRFQVLKKLSDIFPIQLVLFENLRELTSHKLFWK